MHAAAFNGMPDPVFHLTARAMAIVTGLAAVEPDPRAPDNDVLLDAVLDAATGLAQLLRFRGACATADSAAEREAATACLLSAEAELTKAAQAVFTRVIVEGETVGEWLRLEIDDDTPGVFTVAREGVG